jgi:hypothetical protein
VPVISNSIKADLKDKLLKESNSSAVIIRALNFFDSVTYQKHVRKVKPGKSTATVTSEPVYKVDQPMFNVAKAK